MKSHFIYPTYCIIAIMLSVSACNTAQKALDKGDYERSAQMTINKLRSKPSDKKARRVFEQAWPLALEWNQDQIDMLMRSNDPFKWDKIADSYTSLERLSVEVRRCPACLEMVDRPPSYADEILEANSKAAEAHYNAGVQLMNNPSRSDARTALSHFRDADRRVAGYRDINERIIEALEIATLKVLVEHMPVHLRRYEVSNDYFRDEVYNFLEKDNRLNPYVRFYRPEEVDDQFFEEIDHIMRIEFIDFSVGQVARDSETREVFSKDSVKIGDTKLPNGQTVPVYGIVKARFTSYRKTVESGGEIEIRIEDARTGRLLDAERFGGTYVWTDNWASYNGDERALTSDQSRLARRRESIPPHDQDLFLEFTKPVYDRLTDHIRRYYRGY
jgi:hypothetical protein